MPKYWFRQKTFGYGATPNTWQGWLLTLAVCGLIAFVVGEAMTIPDRDTAKLVALSGTVIIVIGFSVIAYIKTEGGWRWRSGRDE
jgi:hypothetical protein